MPAFHSDIINAFIPLLVVLIPAIVTYSVLETKMAFVGGALIGVAVGAAGELLPNWALVLGIVLLAALLFIDSDKIST